ncbi:hypothetical protein HPB52_019599 [Rhipicephalus sanguineus]|uniref:Uncharacterized protein n=1 Tax=Rhipicephalus sanguineus TaxID=34632 RepID=A0A9D4PPN4_RHISA|nr:hypothetical protein HPB52_019599 [Rhipicephalus sanguineus]
MTNAKEEEDASEDKGEKAVTSSRTATRTADKAMKRTAGDYGDPERMATVGEPTVDEAPAMVAVEDKGCKGAKTHAAETVAAAATMTNAKEEEDASEDKGEKAVTSSRTATRTADEAMKRTDELFYIAENRKAPTAETCSVLFGSLCGPLTSEVHNWTIQIRAPSMSRAHVDDQHERTQCNAQPSIGLEGPASAQGGQLRLDERDPRSQVCDDVICRGGMLGKRGLKR